MSSHFPSASPTPTLMASLWPAAQLFIERNVPRHGAALAFYTVFSIAPLLVVVMAGIALLLGTAEAQVAIHDYLLRLLGPVETAAIMEITGRALARIQSAGLAAWIAVGTTLIGASATFLELQAALEAIWQQGPREGPALRRMLFSRLGGLALALGIGFLLAVTLIAEAAMHAAFAWFGEGIAGLGVLVGAVDLLLMNAFSAGLFALLLARLAPAGIGWRAALPAAMVITVLFTVGRYLIAAYLGQSGVASAYGAAGSLAAILMWIYWSAQIFLFGACVLFVQRGAPAPAPEER